MRVRIRRFGRLRSRVEPGNSRSCISTNFRGPPASPRLISVAFSLPFGPSSVPRLTRPQLQLTFSLRRFQRRCLFRRKARFPQIGASASPAQPPDSRRPLGHESFANTCSLAPEDPASYPVTVRRLAGLAPRFLQTVVRASALALRPGRCDLLFGGSFTRSLMPMPGVQAGGRTSVRPYGDSAGSSLPFREDEAGVRPPTRGLLGRRATRGSRPARKPGRRSCQPARRTPRLPGLKPVLHRSESTRPSSATGNFSRLRRVRLG
jgi:hypothetical protein